MAKKLSKKEKRFNWTLFFIVLGLAVTFVGSLYGAYHPKLLISSVVVEGNKTVSDLEIRQTIAQELNGKYLWLYPKRNALIYPREQILVALAATFPRLANIKLEQTDLRNIKLTVRERQGGYLWCYSREVCYFTDETGFAFAAAPKFSSPLYFEFLVGNTEDPIGKYPLPQVDFKKIVDVRKQLNEILTNSSLTGHKTYRASPAELRDWYFEVKPSVGSENSWQIRLDLDQDISSAMKTLKAVLVEPGFAQDLAMRPDELEYIDLRFAPKVFYRYNKDK